MVPFPRYARHIPLMWLHLAALSTAPAQTDIIHGRVTSPRDSAIVGAHVTISAAPAGVVARTRTDEQGMFRISVASRSAIYTIEIVALGFSPRRYELRRSGDSNDFPADARMEQTSATLPPVRARASRRRPPRDDATAETNADRRVNPAAVSADQYDDIAAMAASILGAGVVPASDSSPTGFSVLGLSADRNTATLDGLGVGITELPSNAPVSMSMSTSPYDVSRGGFSGAQVVLRSRRGTNYVTRVMSGSLENDRRTTGGLLSGPIVYDRAFYALSYQLGRRSSELRTLLDMNTSDSASQLADILRDLAVPVRLAQPLRRALADNGSVFGSFDVTGPTRTTGHAFSLTYAGSWNRQTPSFLSPTDVVTRGSTRTSLNGTAQARHTGYLADAVLSEFVAGVSIARSGSIPFYALPTGNVLSDHQMLSFGGALASGRQSSAQVSARNQLSWYSLNEKHLTSISTELRYERAEQTSGGNELGMFSFGSLEALAAAQPSSFSRSLPARPRREGQWVAAVSVGDRYTPVDDVELQYGVRLDANHFTTVPSHNPLVTAEFGVRTGVVPSHYYMSPRLGFSWRHGPQRLGRVQGGVGIFQGLPATTSIAQALGHTGLPAGVRSIACTGDGVPRPDWGAYALDASRIPSACQDGSSPGVASNATPNVVLYDHAFRAPRSLRSNLQWRTPLRGLAAAFEGTYSLNLDEPTSIDLNRINGARQSTRFAHVTALRSDGRSVSRQLSVRLEPLGRNRGLEWSVGYAWANVRERRPEFDGVWAPADRDLRHQVQYALTINPRDLVRITWFGSLRSGLPFTPMVSGDVNGDGYSNDRAFIFATASSDSIVAAGMRALLDNAASSVRACLTAQEGKVAARGSCRGPWSSTSHLTMRINPARLRLPRHATLTLKVSSPLWALDRALHGESGRHGWDDVALPSSTLLFARRFDGDAQRYRYDVNPRFGSTDRSLSARFAAPGFTLLLAFDVGPGQERQMLARGLARGRRTSGETASAESLRRALGAGLDLPNPMAALLRNAASLALTSLQADSIAAMNGEYAMLLRTVWNPVWSALGALPRRYDDDSTYALYRSAREASVDRLIRLAPLVLDLLSPDQRRQLTHDVRAELDVGYLRSIRSGTVSQGVRGMGY